MKSVFDEADPIELRVRVNGVARTLRVPPLRRLLDVLRDEGLQERALDVGTNLIAVLRMMMEEHRLIGDVRGSGLFVGVELVLDRSTRAPAPAHARRIVNRLRDLGILTGVDGPHQNVLKLRPPLVLSHEDADLFLTALDQLLREDGLRV